MVGDDVLVAVKSDGAATISEAAGPPQPKADFPATTLQDEYISPSIVCHQMALQGGCEDGGEHGVIG